MTTANRGSDQCGRNSLRLEYLTLKKETENEPSSELKQTVHLANRQSLFCGMHKHCKSPAQLSGRQTGTSQAIGHKIHRHVINVSGISSAFACVLHTHVRSPNFNKTKFIFLPSHWIF